MTDTAPEGETLELPDPRIEEHEVNAVLLGATSAAERLAALTAVASILTDSSGGGGIIGSLSGFTTKLPEYRHPADLIQLADYVLDHVPYGYVGTGAIIGTISACDCNTPKPGTEEN